MTETANHYSNPDEPEGSTGSMPPDDMEQAALQSIRDRSRNLLEQAFRLEVDSDGDEVYITHDPLATALEDSLAILLTRDGEPPEFEERKDQIYIYFPAFEEPTDMVRADLPMIWLEYINENGESDKVSVTSEGIEPYQEQLDQILDETTKPAKRFWPRGKRSHVTPAHSTLTPQRWRDLVKGFRLSHQSV